jgi:hypothetical protein
MTLVDIQLSPARVLVFSDTMQISPAGDPAGFATKVTVLPHISALWCCRGPVVLSRRVQLLLNGEVFLEHGIDDAVKLLPGLLLAETERRAGRHEPGAFAAEAWLLGWSPAADGFTGYHLPSERDFEARLVPPGLHFNPPLGRETPAELPMAKVIEAALVQREMMARQAEHDGDPWPSIGGDLLAFELTRAGTSIRKVARFPGHGAAVEHMRSQA